MSGGHRRFAGEIVVYGAALGMGQAVTVLVAPALARALGPADYGVVELLTSLLSLVVTVFVAGVDLAALRLYVQDPSTTARRTLLSTGLWFAVGACCVVSGIAIAASTWLSGALLGSDHYGTAFVAAAVTVPVFIGATFSREALRAQRRPWTFLVASTTAAVLGMGVAVLMVVVLHRGATGYYIGLSLGSAAALVLGVASSARLLGGRPTAAALRRLLSLGLPLVPASLSGWSLMLVDRVVLTHVSGLSEVGYYAVANKVANLLLLLVYAFGTAWTPMILALHQENDGRAERLCADAMAWVVGGIGVVAAIVAALSPYLVGIVGGSRFAVAADAVPALCLSLVLFASVPVSQAVLLAASRSRTIALHAVVAALINLCACLLLTPRFGLRGAAVAAVIGLGYQAISYLLAARRTSAHPIPVRRLVVPVAVVLPYLALRWWNVEWVPVGVVAKLVIVATMPLLLVVLGCLPRPRRQLLSSAAGRRYTLG